MKSTICQFFHVLICFFICFINCSSLYLFFFFTAFLRVSALFDRGQRQGNCFFDCFRCCHIFTLPYIFAVTIMSCTRIYLAVAFLYLATVQLPFSAANNQVSSHLNRGIFSFSYFEFLFFVCVPPCVVLASHDTINV